MGRNRLVVPTTLAAGVRPGEPGRPPTSRAATGGWAAVADELRRLTPRDQGLLRILEQHRVLTTEQVLKVGFGSRTRALARLGVLFERDLVDRFRRYRRPGSVSWRWTLGPTGAAIIAATTGRPLPRPGAVRENTGRLAASPTLGHLLGINGWFSDLIAHARHHTGTRLVRWWSEQRATTATGGLVRPDGHGVWVDHGRQTGFWLEYDTGTEPLSRLAAKLTDYARLAGTRWALPVLFWLPNTDRETHLHHHLEQTGIPDRVTIATGTPEGTDGRGGPAGPVWLMRGRPGRLRLSEVDNTAPSTEPVSRSATVDSAIPDGWPWDD